MSRIENGEQAQQVGSSVNGDSLLGNQGMGMVASLHIQAAFQLGVQRHAGQQADKTDGVGIAQERRDSGDFVYIHFPADTAAVHHHRLSLLLGNHRFFQGQLRHRIRNLRCGPRTRKDQRQGQYFIP